MGYRVLEYETMAEREEFELPEPDDVIQRVALDLNINLEAQPTWGDSEPAEKLYPEEASTIGGRILVRECVSELYGLVDISEKPPEWRREPIQIELVQEIVEGHLTWAKKQWADRESPEPFPTITLSNLLGATKRQIAWLKELQAFEETGHFDGVIGVYRSIRTLIERALREE